MKIDPTLQYCTCGHTWKPKTMHKILMLLFGSYTWTCPQCHTQIKFKLINHVVKIETKVIKNKEKMWKNG